jgi:prevent-host-death family protein
MERVVSAAEAQARFGQLLRQVTENRESIVVKRGGRPVAVVIPLAEYERLTQEAERKDWQESLARAARIRDRITSRRGGRPLPPAEEIIRQMREERGEHLLDLR